MHTDFSSLADSVKEGALERGNWKSRLFKASSTLIAFSGGGTGSLSLGFSFSLLNALTTEEGVKGESFGKELHVSVGGTDGLKDTGGVVVSSFPIEDVLEGGGGSGVRRLSLGALKLNVAA